jgi:diadenosine tetraphosphatase ApaH/serine/threonine PP2A family protein phosphatase
VKYAIISDIHGNLTALDAVYDCIGEENCDRIFCLGDLVGYGPFPNECIQRVEKNADILLLGNHDAAAIGTTDTTYFNNYAKEAIEWTAGVLSEKNRSLLKKLELTAQIDEALFVHASPFQPGEWNYILTPSYAQLNFKYFDHQLCFIGHSHVPVSYSLSAKKNVRSYKDSKLEIDATNRYIINVGSVGQPRDGNPDAAFVIYDSETSSIQLKRVSYDIDATQQAMSEAQLPTFLIQRLKLGY